ncbi:MAG: prepilin-type N-terminal cleavage/methylation domain-containing protein [Prevotella sp.]|nr:prepilin-type N-terminal cleavage/methylation domain-containing protein [Prevotella sp.]
MGGVLHFSTQFKPGRLLKPFCGVKQQGFTLVSVLVALILCRLGG